MASHHIKYPWNSFSLNRNILVQSCPNSFECRLKQHCLFTSNQHQNSTSTYNVVRKLWAPHAPRYPFGHKVMPIACVAVTLTDDKFPVQVPENSSQLQTGQVFYVLLSWQLFLHYYRHVITQQLYQLCKVWSVRSLSLWIASDVLLVSMWWSGLPLKSSILLLAHDSS